MVNSICVYCGSSNEVSAEYFQLARDLGRAISNNKSRLVYGGGTVGLMGASAKAAHLNGGDVLGIIPDFLLQHEKLYEVVPHRVVDTMSVRKQMLFEESDAFVVLPGGIGTLEEVVEVLSWAKLDLHQKPIVFLDNDGFWLPLLNVFEQLVEKKFAPATLFDCYTRVSNAEDAINYIESVGK